MSEYTQGVCGDGAALLKDGQPMTVEEVLDRLRERDALAAHVKRYHAAYVKLTNRVEFADNGEGCYVADGELMHEFDAITEDEPTTSLDRFKAQQQAEVLYEFTHGSYIMPADLNLAMSTRAKELRRQAEGGA